MSSTFGSIFSITTFGESHGPGIGVVIDGVPGGLLLDHERINRQLNRRKPGQSSITSPRKESDQFEILSGLYQGKTLGTPLTFFIRNSDVKSGDYQRWANIYRPSHADYTYHAKYSHRTPLGGGRASARETASRVIAGTVAAQILEEELGIRTVAWTDSIGPIQAKLDTPPLSQEEVDASPVRCPVAATSAEMVSYIEELKNEGDSTGGIVSVIVRNVPPGFGDPIFDRLEAELARAALSIPACKGFESGSGFQGCSMKGSEHNDPFAASTSSNTEQVESNINRNRFYSLPNIRTISNRSGGIQGGISNGMEITMRLAFKPTATIRKSQKTVDESGREVALESGGRHDPCVVPRAVPVVEAMVNLVLLDTLYRQRAIHPQWWERWRSEKTDG